MVLFLKLGYDATTLDAIAEAADVSRRSLFDYFPAKEDVLFANQERFLVAVTEEIRRRPVDEPWPVLVEHAMMHAVVDAASPENIAIDAFVRRTPALQSRYQLKYVHLEHAIADALAQRGDGSDFMGRRADLLAALVVAGFRTVTRASVNASPKDGDDAQRNVSQEFRRFWQSLRDFGEQGLAPRTQRDAKAKRPRGVSGRKIGGKP